MCIQLPNAYSTEKLGSTQDQKNTVQRNPLAISQECKEIQFRSKLTIDQIFIFETINTIDFANFLFDCSTRCDLLITLLNNVKSTGFSSPYLDWITFNVSSLIAHVIITMVFGLLQVNAMHINPLYLQMWVTSCLLEKLMVQAIKFNQPHHSTGTMAVLKAKI